jgi:pimeloyl-ACP methyl ester carboxylesterase
MRVAIIPATIVILLAVGALGAAATPDDPSAGGPQDQPPRNANADVGELLRYEPTGLSLLTSYERGKVPVIFIHGLWSSPWSWSRMVGEFEKDPALRGRYQFWTFGYSTGNPIPHSAQLLRDDIRQARSKFDPEGTDAAFDRMVIVGHSMGGLLAKMMAQEGGDRLWKALSRKPFSELEGEPADRELLERAIFYKPCTEVRRVVFIATPHRGSRVDRGEMRRAGSRLISLPDPLRQVHSRLIARNAPDFYIPPFRDGMPTSVEELQWEYPLLMALSDLGFAPAVKVHSIIADRRDPPHAGGTDGLVPYESAHLSGTDSELLVSSGHLCQDNPVVIREVGRILLEHLGSASASTRPPAP